MAERGVEQRLFEEGFAFNFFQAVRLLGRLSPAAVPVGYAGTPHTEIVRFRALPSLNFPASAVHELERPTADAAVPVMTVTFLGLHGPSGVLPRHYTEMILRLERERKGEERRALRDWFDLFNHRFISLFYRAWQKYRFWVAYEDGKADGDGPDPFTQCLYSLIGLGTGGLRRRLRVAAVDPGQHRERVLAGVEDLALAHYAGLLSSRHRHAAGLQALLQAYFGVPVRVRQFVPQWLALSPANQSQLGVVEGNGELGVNTVAGERVLDVQGKVRLRLGPLTYAQLIEFLPDHSAVPEQKAFFLLLHLTRLYVGAELDFDVQLVLRADQVPECQLGEELPGPRLGWNTWLTSMQPAADAADAVFQGEAIVRVDEETAVV